MDRIIIGNDIRINATLGVNITVDPINIHSVRAYLINTTLDSSIKEDIKNAYQNYDNALNSESGKIKYISRFPIEPNDGQYVSTAYDICQSGFPKYKARPFIHTHPYNGFGVYPHTFDGFKNHMWAHDDFRKLRNDIIDAETNYQSKVNFVKYQAYTEAMANMGQFAVFFPAADQKELGVYSLLVVAEIYAPGYSKSIQTKTVTVEFPNIFELVDPLDTSGQNTGVTITAGISDTASEQITNPYEDKFVTKGSYQNDHITLTLSTNETIPGGSIDLSEITAWYENNGED